MPDGGPQSAADHPMMKLSKPASPPRRTAARRQRHAWRGGQGSASGQAPGRPGVEGSQGCRSSSRRPVPTPARERQRRRGRGGGVGVCIRRQGREGMQACGLGGGAREGLDAPSKQPISRGCLLHRRIRRLTQTLRGFEARSPFLNNTGKTHLPYFFWRYPKQLKILNKHIDI